MPHTLRRTRRTSFQFGLVACAALLSACGGGDGPELKVGAFSINPPLGNPVMFSKNGVPSPLKPFQVTQGYGSTAFHDAADFRNVVYTASDRGPNLDCSDSAEAPIGIADFCGTLDAQGQFVADPDGKVFPAPGFAPSIYKFQLDVEGEGMKPRLLATIPLKDALGNPITGLSNDLPDRPADMTKLGASGKVVSNTEFGYGADGKRLPFNQSALDIENMVRAPDGSFWLVEEYAPSVIHASADGRILERIVPADSGLINPITGKSMSMCDALKKGTAATPAAGYPITCALPAILSLRALNRGLENLTISKDGKTLYFAVQSPLANPTKAAYKASRNVRLFTAAVKSDGSFDKVTGEYVYLLDKPETFIKDASTKQNDVKLSEMSLTPKGQLVELERISKTTKLYRVDLNGATNILGTAWDSMAKQPSLEQQTDLAAAGVKPVGKTLMFNTDTDAPNAITKIEGVTFLDEEYLLLINDNDFGIAGDPTVFNLLKAAQQVMK